MVLLSCAPLLTGLLGRGGVMLAVVSLLVIVTWGVVWVRLYTGNRLRPEFAILSILPHSIYYITLFFDSKLFTDATWQNIYGFTWLAFLIVMLISLRPGRADGKHARVLHDPTFILMAIMTAYYTFSTMANFASQIFTA